MTPAPALPTDARPIAGFEDARAVLPGYCVRADGVALWWSGPRRGWLPLREKVGPGGFVKVRLRIGGKEREIGLARLVLRAFGGPRPLGCEPLHFPDPDPANNRADNLRWGPQGASKVGRLCSGRPPVPRRGEEHCHAVLTAAEVPRIRGLYRAGVSYHEIADQLGVAPETVRHVLIGRTWGHVPDPLGPIAMRRHGPDSEESARAKLDWEAVEEVRAALRAGVPLPTIAARHHVSVCCVRDIDRGRTWRGSGPPRADSP